MDVEAWAGLNGTNLSSERVHRSVGVRVALILVGVVVLGALGYGIYRAALGVRSYLERRKRWVTVARQLRDDDPLVRKGAIDAFATLGAYQWPPLAQLCAHTETNHDVLDALAAIVLSGRLKHGVANTHYADVLLWAKAHQSRASMD